MAYLKCLRNVSASSRPDGKTVTPTDDISIWLACGGRSESYTTLSEVLADSTTLSALMADSNAVDYLVRSTTWASGVTADSSAMSYIGLNNYASNTLLADSTWCSAICNSAYFESVLNVKVPTMTSNTTPSGVCFGSSVNPGGQSAYFNAFNGDTSNSWIPASGSTNNYVGYEFTEPVKIYIAKAYIRRQFATPARTLYVRKGDSTSNLGSITLEAGTSGQTQYDYYQCKINGESDTKFQLFCANTLYTAGSWIIAIHELQFYGRADI